MEQTKYYELGIDNVYNVHFPNKQGLSVEQIRDIFAKWGNVLGVTKAGDDYGYRFVRYRTEDEVKRCIEGLRNNREIRLLPKKPKKSSVEQNNGRKSDGNNWKNNRQEPQTSWGSKISENFEKIDPQKTKTRDSKNFRSRNDNETFVVNGKDRKEADESFASNNIPAINENTTSLRGKGENDVSAKVETRKIPENFTTLREKISTLGDPGRLKAAAAVTKNEDIPIIVNGKNELPSVKIGVAANSNITVSSLTPEEIAKEIPDLVISSTLRSEKRIGRGAFAKNVTSMIPLEEQRVVTAEKIVVANVSTDYGENFILHLFRKYEPICICPMKFVPSLAIRFCVVFFPSAHQARAVESEFDNHELGGKNLIVLRPQSLKDISSNGRL